MVDDPCWRFYLDESDLAEIDAAIATSAETEWSRMTKADFPLDRLTSKLQAMSEELEHGSGLARLGSVPVERYDDETLRRLWFGIGLHIGTPLYQHFNGQLMRDITDKREDTDALQGHRFQSRDGSEFASSKARTLSSGPLRFHTDRCDIVALLCLQQATTGGVSQIASSVAVHNLILERRPDLLELLFQPYYRSRLGEEKGGEKKPYALPVFGLRDGKFTSHYSRTYVEAAQELDEVPPLSAEQNEALDLLAEACHELCMETTLQPGEMQFLNNHVIYHARTAFEDEGNSRRNLRRLWLAAPNSRALPDDHAVLWRNVNGGARRGGIALA